MIVLQNDLTILQHISFRSQIEHQVNLWHNSVCLLKLSFSAYQSISYILHYLLLKSDISDLRDTLGKLLGLKITILLKQLIIHQQAFIDNDSPNLCIATDDLTKQEEVLVAQH